MAQNGHYSGVTNKMVQNLRKKNLTYTFWIQNDNVTLAQDLSWIEGEPTNTNIVCMPFNGNIPFILMKSEDPYSYWSLDIVIPTCDPADSPPDIIPDTGYLVNNSFDFGHPKVNITAIDHSTNQVTIVGHNLEVDEKIKFFYNGGDISNTISDGDIYRVETVVDADTVTLREITTATQIDFPSAVTITGSPYIRQHAGCFTVTYEPDIDDITFTSGFPLRFRVMPKEDTAIVYPFVKLIIESD